jgi:hypothetical protein
MLKVEPLLDEINIMLSALWIPFKRVSLGSNFPDVFIVEDLGVVIIGIDPSDYSYMLNKVVAQFRDYRYIFISTSETMYDRKDDVIWDLMRSGYMRYIRNKYTRQFNNLIQNNFGRKIIVERLKVWGDRPQFKYLVEENKHCLNISAPYLVTVDPAFFDYMPEKTTGEENV